MKPFKRSARVAELIQKEVSLLLRKELKDPRVGMVTITAVKVSDDLKIARIFFTVFGEEKQKRDTTVGINWAKGFIKKALREKLSLRFMPEIEFEYDDSFERASRIDCLLKKINEEQGSK